MARKSISRTTYGQRAPSKYRNQKTIVDNIPFDSRKESRRYQQLQRLEETGVIRKLELQPRYDLVVNGQNLGFYKADFRYEQVETGVMVVEDVKSPATRTPVYLLKKKLMKALYGIEIVEV